MREAVRDALGSARNFVREADTEGVAPHVKAYSDAAAYLVALQDQVFERVYTQSSYLKAVATPDIREKVSVYMSGVPEVSGVKGVSDFIYLMLARALAVHGGFGKTSEGDAVNSYFSFFEDYERGSGVPEVILRQLDVVVPGVVAAVAQEYLQKGSLGDESFLSHLGQGDRTEVLLNNSLVYAARIHGEPNFFKVFDAMKGAKLLSPAAFQTLTRRVMDGDALLPEGSEFYLLARALGASVRSFGSGPVAFSQGFAEYPELGAGELVNGLDAPRKKSLPEGNFYFNPVFFFRKPLMFDRRRVSVLGLYYGFDDKLMASLQRVLLGDAALVNFDPDELNSLFETALASNVAFDGYEDSPYEYLRECIVTPDDGGRPDATGYSLVVSKVVGRDFLVGPQGVASVLTALGVADPEMSVRLLQHARGLGSTKHSTERLHNQMLVDPSRVLLLNRMGVSALLSRLVSDVVPLVRVPKPVGVKGGDAVEDATHKTLMALVRLIDQLGNDPASFEYQTRLQLMMGYYCLGARAYEGLGLPYRRLEMAPSMSLVGLLPSLEGKEGIYRQFYLGFRVPYSARMVATADVNLPANVVGLPARVMATLRGHFLSEHLRSVARTEDLQTSMRSRFWAVVFDGYSVDCPDCNMISELRNRIGKFRSEVQGEGSQAVEALGVVLREVGRDLPESERGDFAYVCGVEGSGSLGYSCQHFLRRFAYNGLHDPLVFDYLSDLNKEFLSVISRYPRLHAQSFGAVQCVINSVDDETIRSHPLIAPALNLDYDGDSMETMGVRTLNPLFKPLLDRYAVDLSVFDAGKASDLIFGLNLNALEGLIKGNMHFHEVGASKEGTVSVDRLGLRLPGRDALIKACQSDSNGLVSAYSQVLQGIADGLGRDVVDVASLLVVNPERENETTTVSRFALHQVLHRLLGPEVSDCLGGLYLPDGRKATTSTKALEGLILSKMSGVEFERPALLGVFAGVYNLGNYLAVMESGSASVRGLSLWDQMVYSHDHAFISELRGVFEARVSSLEMAYARGFLTESGKLAALLRLEHGSESDASWQREFDDLRQAYLSSSPETREASYEKVSSYLQGCLHRLDVGLKPLLKAGMRLVADQYEFEYGTPNIWAVQLLSGTIKAKDDLMVQASMGAIQTINGDIVPTTMDDLVTGLSSESLVTAGMPAMWRSVATKLETPVAGDFLKDLESVLRVVTVGKDVGSELMKTPLSVYLDSGRSGDLHLISERCKCRECELVSKVINPNDLARLNGTLRDLCFRVPFDRKALASVFEEAFQMDTKVEVGVYSPLYDKGFPMSVSARSVGVNPMEGLRVRDGVAERVPLKDMPHLQMPVGSVVAGAIGEDGSQSSLRIRHVGGSTVELYDSQASYWKMKFGPLPSRSPYFRQGAEKLQSENPLSYEGLKDYGTAFGASVESPDVPVTKARGLITVGGVEIFNGESYFVKSGRLHVGTDRPNKLTFPLAPSLKYPCAGVEAVVANKLVVRVTPDVFRALFGSTEEIALQGAVFEGHSVSGLCIGDVCKVMMPSPALEAFVSKFGAPLKVQPSEDARYRVVSDLEKTAVPVLYRVQDALAFAKVNGFFVPEGAVFGSHDDSVSVNTARQTRELTQGFGTFLDHLKGRALTPYSATLAPAAGVVEAVRFLGTQGDVSAFEVDFRCDSGNTVSLDMELPKGHFPSVQPAQRLDAGDPMSFGYVPLGERAKLRPDFRREFADYLYAYHYDTGESSMWSTNTEMLARALVFPTVEGDRFVPLGKAYQTIGDPNLTLEDSRLLRPHDAAGRLGNFDALLRSMFLNVGMVSEGKSLVFSPDELSKGDLGLVHPLHQVAKSSDYCPRDLGIQGSRSVEEIVKALNVEM
jgi:hypothetical protein